MFILNAYLLFLIISCIIIVINFKDKKFALIMSFLIALMSIISITTITLSEYKLNANANKMAIINEVPKEIEVKDINKIITSKVRGKYIIKDNDNKEGLLKEVSKSFLLLDMDFEKVEDKLYFLSTPTTVNIDTISNIHLVGALVYYLLVIIAILMIYKITKKNEYSNLCIIVPLSYRAFTFIYVNGLSELI